MALMRKLSRRPLFRSILTFAKSMRDKLAKSNKSHFVACD